MAEFILCVRTWVCICVYVRAACVCVVLLVCVCGGGRVRVCNLQNLLYIYYNRIHTFECVELCECSCQRVHAFFGHNN